MKDVRFIEMYAGIGGFRLGLSRASDSTHKQIADSDTTQGSSSSEKRSKPQLSTCDTECADSKQRVRSSKRQSEPLSQRSRGGNEQKFRCVWANDNDKYACKVYRRNFGSRELVEGDIRDIQAAEIPDCELLTAGFPCQAFSLAGKRKGLTESRGTLFSHILRVAAIKRPQVLLLENVRGLLSSSLGRDFAIILRGLGKLGYLLEWQVLNSKHHGVPQNRERVFIIGHLNGESARTIFPLRKGSFKLDEVARGRQVSFTIDSSYWKGDDHKRQLLLHNVYGGFKEGMRVFEKQSPTLRTPKGGGHLPLVASAVDCDGYLRRGTRPRDEQGKPQFLPIGYRRIRRLTPVECERLQGFPDNWTARLSDTQRYKCLGNAVTVNVITQIGLRLGECFK